MKLAIQYLNDSKGNTRAVQIPLSEWEKVVSTMKKYEQLLKIKSDLKVDFSEVEKMKKGKIKMQTLSDFLERAIRLL